MRKASLSALDSNMILFTSDSIFNNLHGQCLVYEQIHEYNPMYCNSFRTCTPQLLPNPMLCLLNCSTFVALSRTVEND